MLFENDQILLDKCVNYSQYSLENMRGMEPIIRNTRINILEETAQFIEQRRRNLKEYVNWTSNNRIPKIF
jgi:hypothetical protein